MNQIAEDDSEYISQPEEEKFKSELVSLDLEEYCRYMLAKIHWWIKLVHNVDLKSMVGVFMGSKLGMKLYDCKIVEMSISDPNLSEKIFAVTNSIQS